MSTNPIRPVEAMVSRIRDLPTENNDVTSLDDRLLQAFSTSAVSSATERNDILESLNQADTVTDPAKLYDLQIRSSNYNLEVSMISTLARKTVGAVESLLRS